MTPGRSHTLVVLLCVIAVGGAASTAAGNSVRHHGSTAAEDVGVARVTLRSPIGLFQSTPVTVRRITARRVEIRLLGAIDAAGRAYEWTPYRWRPLRLREGAWRGRLPAPALFGIYPLQIRIDGLHSVRFRGRRLLRVFPHGAGVRPAYATPGAVVRAFVAHLP
jgi:hypothetical protein